MRRDFNKYLSITLLSYAAVRIFFLLADFEMAARGNSILYNQFYLAAYLFAFIAVGVISHYFDKYLLYQKKKFLSKLTVIYGIINAILLLLLPLFIHIVDVIRILFIAGLYFSVAIFGYLTLKIVIGTKIRNFKKFKIFLLGFFLFILGSALDNNELYDFYLKYPILMLIPPCLVIFGLIFLLTQKDLAFNLFLEYYSSQQFCLIHRGKIEGKINFCPKCFVEYCERCFSFIMSSEKECWACHYHFVKEEITPIEEDLADESEFHKKKI
jgi:hypothetical protein